MRNSLDDAEIKNLYAGAVAYINAAQLLTSHPQAEGRMELALPIHTCLGLSIEMLLKALFLSQGGNPAELRKREVRHNLKELRDLSRAEGYTIKSSGVDDIIDHIGDNYAAHDYRYMRTNAALQRVNVPLAVSLIQAFVDEVAAELGYPIRPDPV